MNYRVERHPKLLPEELVVVPKVAGGTHTTYLLDPRMLRDVYSRFRPDHIHVEEDPHSMVGTETVAFARLFSPRASLSFFIWDNLARSLPFPRNAIKGLLARFSLSHADLVVCGNAEAERLLKGVKGYSRRTMVLPQVGLDPEDYLTPPSAAIQTEMVASSGEPWIGFVGRFVPEKGLILLLESLVSLQHLPWKLLVIGSGPLRDDVLSRWQPLLGPRILCLDAVPHREVADYLKCLNIFVLPSYGIPGWKEQFGLTLAQAMMAGVACVGSSSGAIPEVLGQAGAVFEEGDVRQLSDVLARLLLSPEERVRLGQAARALALTRYTNHAVASAQLTAFASLRVECNCGNQVHHVQ